MRKHCNYEELEAHRILDLVKAGVNVPESTICWALFVLGDGVGYVNFGGRLWMPIAYA
jgi:hypothetical protein